MAFKAVPLDMISSPNFYSELDGAWKITSPNQQTLWFQLNIIDSLGQRRYIAAAGATLTALFRRMDLITSQSGKLNQQTQNITKTVTFNTSDRSLCSIVLTQQDVQNIVSGGIVFTLVESGTTTQWIEQWIVSKNLTGPGH
jgi:hypothetical protein